MQLSQIRFVRNNRSHAIVYTVVTYFTIDGITGDRITAAQQKLVLTTLKHKAHNFAFRKVFFGSHKFILLP